MTLSVIKVIQLW